MDAEMQSPSVPTWDQEKVHAKEKPILVTGKAEPNSTVHVFVEDGLTLLGTTKANENGTFELELDLKNGSYSLLAQAENVAGVGDYSGSLHLVISVKGNGKGKQEENNEEVEVLDEAS